MAKGTKITKASRIEQYLIEHPTAHVDSVATRFFVAENYVEAIKKKIARVETPKVFGKRGPRERRFPCAAINDNELVYEAVVADTSEEAMSLFKTKYGIVPKICDSADGKDSGNGYFIAKSGGPKKRLTITLPAKHFRPSGTNFTGQFQGWNVIASGMHACSFVSPNSTGTRSFKKDALLCLTFVSPIDPDSKINRPRNKKLEVVLAKDVDNLQVMDEQES